MNTGSDVFLLRINGGTSKSSEGIVIVLPELCYYGERYREHGMESLRHTSFLLCMMYCVTEFSLLIQQFNDNTC